MSKFIKYIKRYWRSTKSLAGGLKTSIKVFFRESDGAVSGKPAYDALHTGTSSGTVGNDS